MFQVTEVNYQAGALLCKATALEQGEQKIMQLKGIWIAKDQNHI